jgi:glucose-1-phosphate cytidylyltransferase
MIDVTAILLCGGKGERLRPFTETLPKALVPLNGKPLLEHLMRYLSLGGVRRFVVCVGYKADSIRQFLEEQTDPESTVVCVDSGEEASITDRVLDARAHVEGRALVCYGDTLANVDLSDLVRQHEESGALGTLTVYPLHSPFGIVEFGEDGRVTRFVEKPRLPHWINVGFLLCEPHAFDYIVPGTDVPNFLGALSGAGHLGTYRHTGKHLTVNTEKDRASAETEMVEFFTLIDSQTT